MRSDEVIGACPRCQRAIPACICQYKEKQVSQEVDIAPWMQTYNGVCAEPLDLKEKHINLQDVAHALALKCRFGCHCRTFYSVAEHSVRTSVMLQHSHNDDPALCMLGLMHDASEVYLPDLIAPLKAFYSVNIYHENQTVSAKNLEYRVWLTIMQGLLGKRRGVRAEPLLTWMGESAKGPMAQVKFADMVMLATERRDLMGHCSKDWIELPQPLPEVIKPWKWEHAKSAFLHRFMTLADCLANEESVPAWDEYEARNAYDVDGVRF